jgi:hypothetical protein
VRKSLPVEAVKAQEYRIHIYPRELARTIAAQWTIASDAAVSLPPEEELATFLSEAYQASLLREEDRPVNCRLILIDPSELSDNTGPPGGLQVLHLVDERKLREHEIRRRALGENVTKRIISHVQHARHGGMLIITMPGAQRLVSPTGPIRPKYWIRGTKASQRYRDLIFSVMRTLSVAGAHPECMITVVSQDGSVRYVGNPNGRSSTGMSCPFRPLSENFEKTIVDVEAALVLVLGGVGCPETVGRW